MRQPWAELIIAGTKPVENRKWTTPYRGRLYIHAARFRDDATIAQFDLDPAALSYGALIGYVDVIDMVRAHPSPHFSGPCISHHQRFTELGQLGCWGLPISLRAERPLHQRAAAADGAVTNPRDSRL